ncbi:type IV pilus biogenesis/stability protein PilW [Candidatus Aalborgicola defluviihabitans]|uniref:type IV pilus biogenesis/stability protein PilW n=1 Tax=Candidatus Aalborgicola defluviihabitans TaxID=3386187 RepID=UPI001D1FADDB|nr:type IV pilus biogenesis/stability protein PilW [Burkholderiales bacterium]MBK7313238.1 type IV pilus biogenesis/stability protein PilW [Burkholderiales bacterium]
MIDKLRIGVATLSWVFLSCLTGTAVIGLTGCATNATGVASSGDFVTESDESDSHKRARLRLELAAAYFDKGQATDALDHLKQSIAADPNLFEAYNLRGLIYMRLNDLPLADESFRRALVINPKAASVQHNYGWMLCQQSRYPEAMQMFANALGNPTYGDRAKTWMAQGLCQQRGGQMADAENSLLRSYELDAGNPITAYNLSLILYQRGEFVRSQFYVRRLNNSELANSESLWLGIKVERRLENREAMAQLSSQLKKRFPQSREFSALERGAFNE